MNKALVFTIMVIIIKINVNSSLNMNKKKAGGFSSSPFQPQQLSRPYRAVLQSSPPNNLENDNIGVTVTQTQIPTPNTIAAAETSGPGTKLSTENVSSTSATEPLCISSCQKELKATELLTEPSEPTVRVGSSVTLTCSLMMGEEFINPEVRWLFKATNMMQTECSLTPQEFIPNCKGFASVSASEDRTNTSMVTTLTTTSLNANNTGIYSCQIEAVCCLNSTTHILRHQEEVNILVWDKDYTLEILIFAIAVGVLFLVVAGSTLYSNLKRPVYEAIDDSNFVHKQPEKVLHLPMYEDDDDDSFDENFDLSE